MKGLLSRCPDCYSYTLREVCEKCGAVTVIAHPARYSPDDKYARYRSPTAYTS